MQLVSEIDESGTPRKSGHSVDVSLLIESASEATVFHEAWWLHAATGGRYEEVVVRNGDQMVGWLPFVTTKRMGLTFLTAPPLTHALGPVVDAGAGKPQTQLMQRLSIVRALVEQLPRFDSFKQVLPAASADGLAFQYQGFEVRQQFNFEIECRSDTKQLWDAMHFKTRQHIRRAGEKLSLTTLADPEEFVRFYNANLRQQGVQPFRQLEIFPAVFRASQAKNCGEVICARWPDGRAAAMVFLLWSKHRMYYLLSTRSVDPNDNGSISFLIWSAMQRAHSLGLKFDLDGVSTAGIARFLLGFGGQVQIRTIVERTTLTYRALRLAKRTLLGGDADQTIPFA
jgi:hypothetical protein